MSRSLAIAVSCTLAVVLAGGAFVARSAAGRGVRVRAPQHAASLTPAEADSAANTARAALEADIALFERRIAEDPISAADRSRIAALYLRRARETGSYTDVERAAAEARASLELREGHNEATYGTLATALLAQHDFVGALAATRALVAAAPEVVSHRAQMAEVLLELGRYGEADTVFASVEREKATLSTAPRLTRWYEVTGHLSRARAMAGYALRLTTNRQDLSPEQRAWYYLRAGELDAKGGAVARADSLYGVALAIHPNDYRVLAARAKLAAARGDWKATIALGDSAIATQLDPATLGLLRDAWHALGDTAQAASYARAMTASALTQPGAIHRAWGLHLADRGERVGEVLRRVRRELEERRDVYGYDLEAWALHRLRRDAEAWTSIDRALSQGTEDAQLWYHAGAIAAATGRGDEARRLLERALALNPAFAYDGAREARRLLDSLNTPVAAVLAVPVAPPRGASDGASDGARLDRSVGASSAGGVARR